MGPYVLESPIRMGLKKLEILEVKLNGTRIVIGEILEIHLEEENILGEDGFIHPEKAKLVSSVGLDAYYLPSLLSRLSYAKPYKDPETI
jgi:flavin reductase (DIM6/NTAB) family NADH-FMN oxidoreductase RutF